MTTLDVARGYITEREWALIPVHGAPGGCCGCGNPRCPSPGKHPIRSGWTQIEKAATTPADAYSYWGEEHPDANVGVLTGHASGIWVLDVDLYRERDALAKLVEYGGGEQSLLTLTHKTGSGGLHFFFRMPDGADIGSYRLQGFAGIDIRGEGGQVVLPPSVSGSGAYEVLLDVPIAHAPEWLIDVVRRTHYGRGLAGPPPAVNGEEVLHIPPAVRVLLEGEIPTGARDGEGRRYKFAARFIWTCKESGLTQGQTVTLFGQVTPVMGKFEGREEERVAVLWGIHDQRRAGLVLEGVPALPPEVVREQIQAVNGAEQFDLGDGPLDALVARDWLAHRIDWAEAWDRVSEDPTWTWFPLFQRGRLYAVYSAPKLGKSLLLLEGCANLAAGRETPGGQTQDRPLRIIYADRENTDEDIVTRLKEMGVHYKDIEKNFHYFIHPTNSILNRPAHAEAFLHLADVIKPDLIVFDTTMRFMEGSENDTEPFFQFYNECLSGLKSRGITVIRVDHTGKNPARGQRGSSAKVGDVDGAYELRRVGESGTRFKLTCTESRTRHAPEWVSITRHEDPVLRHEFTSVHHRGEANPGGDEENTPPGWSEDEAADLRGVDPSHERVVNELVATLDRLGVPLDAGRRTVATLLRDTTGEGVRAVTLAEAIRRRRARKDPDLGE